MDRGKLNSLCSLSIVDQRTSFKYTIRKLKIEKAASKRLLSQKESANTISAFIQELSSKYDSSRSIDFINQIASIDEVADILAAQNSTVNDKRKALLYLKNKMSQSYSYHTSTTEFSFNSREVLSALATTLSNFENKLQPDLIFNCLNILEHLIKKGQSDMHTMLQMFPELVSSISNLSSCIFSDLCLYSCYIITEIISLYDANDLKFQYLCGLLGSQEKYLERLTKLFLLETREIGDIILIDHFAVLVNSMPVQFFLTFFQEPVRKLSEMLKQQYEQRHSKAIFTSRIVKLVCSMIQNSFHSSGSADVMIDTFSHKEFSRLSRIFIGFSPSGYSFLKFAFSSGLINTLVRSLDCNFSSLEDHFILIGNFMQLYQFTDFQKHIKSCINFIDSYIHSLKKNPLAFMTDLASNHYLEKCLSFIFEITNENRKDNSAFTHIDKSTQIFENLSYIFSLDIPTESQLCILKFFTHIYTLYTVESYMSICSKEFYLKIIAIIENMRFYFNESNRALVIIYAVNLLVHFVVYWGDIGSKKNYMLEEIHGKIRVETLEDLKRGFDTVGFNREHLRVDVLIEYLSQYE